MAEEHCFRFVCLVPLQDPAPDVFGLSAFLSGLALMVLAWTTSDARYRFRVASAAVNVYAITYTVVAGVGLLVLLTALWHAQHWPVLRGPLITPAGWQVLLGSVFITTFLYWAWLAFFRPSIFSRANAKHYASAFCHAVLRGSDLAVIANEAQHSADALVRNATNMDRTAPLINDSQPARSPSEVEACANRILLMMADRRFCRAVIESSPMTAIALFDAISKAKRFGVPIDVFARNLLSEALTNRGSFLFNEAEGYETGLLGFDKPLTQAMFSDFALVEGVGSLLDLDWKQARELDPPQWEAYCRVALVAFEGYVKGKAPAHSPVIYGAIEELKHAVEDLYKLNGVTDEWDRPSYSKLNVVVRFIKAAIRALNTKGRPDGRSFRLRRFNSGDPSIYDTLAGLLVEVIWNAARVQKPTDLCWSIQHNSVWSDLWGPMTDDGPAAQIVKRKAMAEIYREISELRTFPNFKGARFLGFCLNVMGLTLNHDTYHRDSLSLQRAVLRWTKRYYAALRQRNQEVADICLTADMSFDAERSRIVKCQPVDGLRREARYTYLPVDPE